jgi:hypothetical protein
MVLRSIVSALVLLLPLAASAQDAPGQHLEMRRDRESAARRPIVHPAPPVDEAVRDAERATAEYERAQRAEELLREQKAAAANRRPDLNYDVTSGIQQRNLLNLR